MATNRMQDVDSVGAPCYSAYIVTGMGACGAAARHTGGLFGGFAVRPVAKGQAPIRVICVQGRAHE